MISYNHIDILQYNMHKSKDVVMAPFFRDKAVKEFTVIAAQEIWVNDHEPTNITTHHPRTDLYELAIPRGTKREPPRVCFYINKKTGSRGMDVSRKIKGPSQPQDQHTRARKEDVAVDPQRLHARRLSG